MDKRDGSGPPITLAVRVANHEKIISASGTKRCLAGRNPRYEGRVRYRTADDVRAIPNAQWERWVREQEPFPGIDFSSDWATQHTVTAILDATKRRLNYKRPAKPKPVTMREVAPTVQLAYRMFRRHVLENGLLDPEEMDG